MVSFKLSQILNFEVGILFFWQIFLVKIFEPSSFEEILSGPKTLIDLPLKWLTIPLTNIFLVSSKI